MVSNMRSKGAITKMQGVIIAAIIVVAVVAGAAAYIASLPPPAKRVLIGVGVDVGYTPWYVAESQGIFKKYGVIPEVKQFAFGGAAVDSVLTGEVDVGAAADLTALIRVAKGDVVIVCTVSKSFGDEGLAVKKTITKADDLKGKKLGILAGTVLEMQLMEWLASRGIGEKDVTFVPLGPPEAVAALDKGEIDGFWLHQPWPAKALEVSGEAVRILGKAADIGFHIRMVVVANARFVRESPDALRGVLKALIEADGLITSNPDLAAQITESAIKLPKADAKKQMEWWKYEVKVTSESVESWKRQTTWALKKGIIKSDINWSEKLVLDPLRSVEPKAVE